jgi:hypothetical protein
MTNWVAEAALVVDNRESGTRAAANMIALGLKDLRDPGILTLGERLERRGWLLIAPNSNPNGEGPANPTNLLKPSSKDLNAEDRLEFDTLVLIAQVAWKATYTEKETQVERFLTRSKSFLNRHPDEFGLWFLRAAICLDNGRAKEGMEPRRI